MTSLDICDPKENNELPSQPISTIQSRHEKETIELLSTDEVSETASCPYQIDLGKESYSSQLPFYHQSLMIFSRTWFKKMTLKFEPT